MKNHAHTVTCALVAAGLAGVAIAPAHASEIERMSVTVTADDLNLASPAGKRTLDQRVEKAVRSVCRTRSVTTGSRILSQGTQTCLAKARADAQQQVAVLIRNNQRGG